MVQCAHLRRGGFRDVVRSARCATARLQGPGLHRGVAVGLLRGLRRSIDGSPHSIFMQTRVQGAQQHCTAIEPLPFPYPHSYRRLALHDAAGRTRLGREAESALFAGAGVLVVLRAAYRTQAHGDLGLAFAAAFTGIAHDDPPCGRTLVRRRPRSTA